MEGSQWGSLKRQDNRLQPVTLNWIPLQEQLWNYERAGTSGDSDATCRWQNPTWADGRQEREELSWSWEACLRVQVEPTLPPGGMSGDTRGGTTPRDWVHTQINGVRASELRVMTPNRSQMFVSGRMVHWTAWKQLLVMDTIKTKTKLKTF